MNNIILKRHFEPEINRKVIKTMIDQGAGCMQTYRVNWVESFLSLDGSDMICHFIAPDTEAVRTTMHTSGMAYESIWPGTLHDNPNHCDGNNNANIMVERQFDEPTSIEVLQAIEDKGAHCLKTWNVSFIRTYFSVDKKNMLCLYQAPDAESVRQAQTKAGMPFKRVWAFDYVTPTNL